MLLFKYNSCFLVDVCEVLTRFLALDVREVLTRFLALDVCEVLARFLALDVLNMKDISWEGE